jgi:hypothetical protein
MIIIHDVNHLQLPLMADKLVRKSLKRTRVGVTIRTTPTDPAVAGTRLLIRTLSSSSAFALSVPLW